MLYFAEIVSLYFRHRVFSVSIRKNVLGKHINECNFYETCLAKSTLNIIFLCETAFFFFLMKQIELFKDKFHFPVISE